MTVGKFRVWPFGHQAPAHARQPVVQVGFCPFGDEMMVVRRIPSRMRCNNQERKALLFSAEHLYYYRSCTIKLMAQLKPVI